MKLPFSYRHSSFSPLVFASLVSHLAVVGTAGSFFSSPLFSVERAPSSVEVVFLEEKRERKEKAPFERVLTQVIPVQSSETIASQPKPRETEKVSVKKRVHSREQGILQETSPLALKNPPPVYPLVAKENGWQGRVIVQVWVEPDGRPSRVVVLESSGYPVLDAAALKAIGRWLFLPARVGNFSFASWIKIPVRFVLTEGDEDDA